MVVYMTGEQSYRYYNEFLWPDRYADCVPMDKALKLLKSEVSVEIQRDRRRCEERLCLALLLHKDDDTTDF